MFLILSLQLTGTKAPPLKRIHDWLRENPQFDIDPKWAELVKEKANLPHDLQKRLPTIDRKKGPGRPPILASPPTSVATSISSSLPTSLASNLQFSSLASVAGLGGINPSSLLSGLNFDPKTNMILPFTGMSNMNALSGMSGLGNMNLFANLASLGMGGLAGMDGSSLSGGDHGNSSTGGGGGGSGIGSTAGLKSSKSRKQQQQDSGGGGSNAAASSAGSNSKAPSVSAASGLPSSLPFFFPNPSLLYGPLGLTGLNPFTLQPGSMPQYDSLALLNGGLGGITSSGSASNTTTSRHKTSTSRGGGGSTAMVSSSSASSTASPSVSGGAGSQRQSSSSRSATPHSQQFQLPPDSHLLDTLTKSRGSADTATSSASSSAKSRMREVDSLRTLISHIGGAPFNFAGLGVDPKKLKDHEFLESLHNKFPVDMFGRLPTHTDERKSTHGSSDLMEKLLKRSAPASSIDFNVERPSKRSKESSSSAAAAAAAAAAGMNVPAMSKLFSSNNVTVTAESIPSAGMDLSSGNAATVSGDRGKEAPGGAALDCRSSSPATTSALSLTVSPVSRVKSSGSSGASVGATTIVAESRSKTPPVARSPAPVQVQPAPSPSPTPPTLPPPEYPVAGDSKTIADEPPSLLPPPTAPSPFLPEESTPTMSASSAVPLESEKTFVCADVATDSAEESEAADLKMDVSDGGADDVDDQKTDSSAVAAAAPETSSALAGSSLSESQRSPSSIDKEDGGVNRKRKPRNKKNPIAPEEAIERKNLRSSAGRAAAVAAARAARAAAAAQDESADDRKDDESLSGL